MPNTNEIITMSGRSAEEIKAEIRFNMRNMVNSAVSIGLDLLEMKEACRHGEWLPFLKEIGISSSTARNYMNIAEQVSADSKMAQLPYTKILALLSAPPEDREELAEMAEGMSAAEIRRLTEERNKAAEAANMETARADQAERDAKAFNQENANLRNHVSVLQNELNKEKQHVQDLKKENTKLLDEIDDMANNPAETKLLSAMMENEQLKADLLAAENNRVEVEVFPADYEELKRQQKELIEAAAEAEARAADAEAALEEARSENARNGISEYEKLHLAMKNFLMQCELMACNPAGLLGERDRALKDVERLQQWCEVMGEALKGVIPVKAVVL